MKIFAMILTFIGCLILFSVIGGQLFTGAAAIKFLFAFLMATFIVLFGWGFVDMLMPPKNGEE